MVFPIMLDLSGRRVLVVGGGNVAARKIEALAAAGGVITVVAPSICAAVRSIPGVVTIEREYRSSDVAEHVLVFTATDAPDVNRQVALDANGAGVFVNSADDPDNCSAMLPAVLRRGSVVVAVSTSGTAPAFASWLRDRVAAVVDERAAVVAQALAEERRAVHAAGGSTEEVNWVATIERLWEERAPR